MFLIIVLSIWTALHVYAFWRAASVPYIAQHVPRAALIALAAVLWSSFFLARILDRPGLAWLARPLDFLGSNWIGVLFLISVCFLAADMVTGFGYLLPRLAPAIRGWALVAAGVLSAIAFVQGGRAPVVRHYDVRLAGLPAEQDGTVLVLASDFHLGSELGQDWLAARIRQIEAERPNAVVLGGDIVEGDDAREREFLPLLRQLTAPEGVWAVTGNHETHFGLDGGGARLLEDAGFHVLSNRWAEVRPGLLFAGVDDLTSSRRRRGSVDASAIERALAGRPVGAATVLVSHTPWQMDKAASAGVGLMLCAHTHGGQIWPFGYVVRLFYPLLGGRYEVNGMPVIVCRGTGTWGPRMRLWRRGELVRITLRAQPAGEAQGAAR